MYIKVKLSSDLCAASGSGYAGSVDTDINYDSKTGLPYVPSKRIKGCLREAGLDILSVYPMYANAFYSLFGQIGKADGGKLKISNGRLNYNTEGLSKYSVLDELTTLRSGIRMEVGKELIQKTRDKSLRVARVLNKDEYLFFKVENNDDDVKFDPCEVEFLRKCCMMLRGIGSNRTRGWGEIECSLVEKPYPIAEAVPVESQFEIFDFGGQKIVSYEIKLEETVISTLLSGADGCEGYLPGSMLLGFFVNRWLKTHQSIQNERKNPEFRRLFLEDGIKFGSAYPGRVRPFYPTPASIRTDKTGYVAYDTSVGDNDAVSQMLGGFADLANEYGILAPKVAGVRFDIAPHHRRPYDRAIGHAQKGGNAKDGAFYSYESLSAGQTFYGSIVGSQDDLLIIKGLSRPKIQLGRSRSSQYGNAAFRWISEDNMPYRVQSVPVDGKVCAYVRSPLILHGEDGTIAPDAKLLADHLGLVVENSFLSETLVAGYNTKWLLPRPHMSAIKAGSVVVMRNDTKDDVELEAEQFIGLRTGEGFGHISLLNLPVNGELLKPEPIDISETLIVSGSGMDLNSRIQLKKAKHEYEQFALDDENICSKNAPTNAQLGRLLGVLRREQNPIKSLKDLRDELRDNDPIWKDPDKRKIIQDFCSIGEGWQPLTEEWDNYKVWLTSAIRKVMYERRRNNVL